MHGIASAEFELIMQNVAATLEQRNLAKTAQMGMCDPRFKA